MLSFSGALFKLRKALRPELRSALHAWSRGQLGALSFNLTFLLLTASLGFSACSPGTIFGGGDQGVADTRSYRRVNLACAGLNLADANLSVADFRRLLHCFNSNGGLEPIENLVNRLSDADLKPIVDTSNHYLLNNRKLLFQLEKTYFTLGDLKILDSTFLQFGRLLQNESFVSSSIAILKEGYTAQRGPNGIAGDRAILLALQQLATRITPENVASALDIGLTASRTQAFSSLQARFRGPSLSGRSLRDLTDQGLAFLQNTGDPKHVEAGLRLLEELANGHIFQAMDELLGTSPETFPTTIPRLASVLNVTLGNNAHLMDGLTSLFHYIHRPIHCLKGAETIPDGTMHVIHDLLKRNTSEAASYIKRTGPLSLMALAPLCDLSPEVGRFYPTMFEIADTTAVQPMTDLLRAFYRITETNESGQTTHPLAELLVDVLGDTGSGEATYPGGPAENTAGVKLLLPMLAELTDRGVWNDTFLLLTAPRLRDRVQLQESVRFLTQPMPGTDESIYAVLTEAVSRATPLNLYNFVHSLDAFVNAEKPLLEPALTALRQAYYVNDVHPLIDLVQSLLADAPQNDALINTMFLISETSEFKESVRLVSDMAKDGRLKELLGAVITVFHRFATQGATPLHLTLETPFEMKARHNLAESDLGGTRLGDEPSVSNDACRQLDPRVSLGDYHGADFYNQLGYFKTCMDADRAHGDFADVIEFLNRNRNERGKNYIESTLDLLWALDMTREELKYLGDTFLTSFDDLRLSRALDAAKILILSEVHGDSDGNGIAGPVLRPVLDGIRPILTAQLRPALHRLEVFAASVLRRADFPSLLGYIDDLLDDAKDPLPTPSNVHDLARIKRWIGNKECQNLPAHGSRADLDQYLNRRATQIVGDYESAITTWDLAGDGQPRRNWSLEEFKGNLDDVFTKFGDSAQASRPGGATDALLHSLRYFTLPEGQAPNEFQHYHADELRRFLIDRSNDYQLMTYFYPGESAPRVRLVSTMDRLELVLINADFWSPWPKIKYSHGIPIPDLRNQRNFALLFMGQIADAWGDEDPRTWPQAIRDKFAGTQPPTLAQAVASMKATAQSFERLVGFPALAYCNQVADPNDPADLQYAETHDPIKSGIAPGWLPALHIPLMRKYLFNIHQVFPALEENLPAAGQPLGKGGKMVNGLRILRDLFFQLLYSSPEGYMFADWDRADIGWKNNLSIIMKLERAGFTRQITRGLRGMQANDPVVVDFFNALIEGATSSDDPIATTRFPRYKAHLVVDPLVDPALERDPSRPQHELLWKAMEQVFGVIDAAKGGLPLDAAHQKEIAGQSPSAVAEIREKWVKEYDLMKQLGFYTFAAAHPLGLIQPALKTIGPVLNRYHQFFVDNADKVQDALRSNRASYLMRGLYESRDQTQKSALSGVLTDLLNVPQNGMDGVSLIEAISKDSVAKQGLQQFSDRWDALSARPDYQQTHASQLKRDALDFLEQRGTNAEGRAAARRLLDYSAERMEGQDLDQYLMLASRDPNGFYQVLRTLGHYIDDGELMEFFQTAHDAFVPPARR